MCDTGERRHAHFDMDDSDSIRNYVTTDEWRFEHFGDCDPRWPSICWDHCLDEAPSGCYEPCDVTLCNWVNWGPYGLRVLNLRDMAGFWLGRITGGDPNLYYLGPVMHALHDASEPHHAAGYNGNFHDLWESTISRRLDENPESFGTFDASVGRSTGCTGRFGTSDWTECAVLWAGSYLRSVYSLFPGECPGMEETIPALIEILHREAREEYDTITPILEQYFTGIAEWNCFKTLDHLGENHELYDPDNRYPYMLKWETNPEGELSCWCKSKDLYHWLWFYTAKPEDHIELLEGNAVLVDEQYKEIDRLTAASLAAVYLAARDFDCTAIDGDRDGFVADVCEGHPDGEDLDEDEIPDGCDLCPQQDALSVGLLREDDRAGPEENDPDGDGWGVNCDNCDVWNPDQANCNWHSEDRYSLGHLGDACDPDPCVSLCRGSDPLAPQGECTLDDSHYLFGMGTMMFATATVSTGAAWLDHYDVAEGRRYQGQQIYWCSCYNPNLGVWLDDVECTRQCLEDGEQTFNEDTNIGWSEAVRENTLVRSVPPFPCSDEPGSSCPCSVSSTCDELPPCSPTLSPYDRDPATCLYKGSHPKAVRYGPYDPTDSDGRADLHVADSLLLDLPGIQYPADTPEDQVFGTYNRLKFWIRPVDVRRSDFNKYDKETYWPPSERGQGENRGWNNEYTAYQHVLSNFVIPVGYAHLAELSDGHFLRLLRDWRSGVDPGAKDDVVIPEGFYWRDGDCPPWLWNLCYFDVSVPGSALTQTKIRIESPRRIGTRRRSRRTTKRSMVCVRRPYSIVNRRLPNPTSPARPGSSCSP